MCNSEADADVGWREPARGKNHKGFQCNSKGLVSFKHCPLSAACCNRAYSTRILALLSIANVGDGQKIRSRIQRLLYGCYTDTL
jgi:hypothetical protein